MRTDLTSGLYRAKRRTRHERHRPADTGDAEVIADELRLSVATVKEVIKAFEDGEYKTR